MQNQTSPANQIDVNQLMETYKKIVQNEKDILKAESAGIDVSLQKLQNQQQKEQCQKLLKVYGNIDLTKLPK